MAAVENSIVDVLYLLFLVLRLMVDFSLAMGEEDQVVHESVDGGLISDFLVSFTVV